MSHPGVDLLVDEDEVDEGNDAGGEEPDPVDVVIHVVFIQPETMDNVKTNTFEVLGFKSSQCSIL